MFNLKSNLFETHVFAIFQYDPNQQHSYPVDQLAHQTFHQILNYNPFEMHVFQFFLYDSNLQHSKIQISI